jgi:hypothetical protein
VTEAPQCDTVACQPIRFLLLLDRRTTESTDRRYVSVPVLFNRSFSKKSGPQLRIFVAQLDGTSAETRLSYQEPYQQATSSAVMTRMSQTRTLSTPKSSKSWRDSVVFSYLGHFNPLLLVAFWHTRLSRLRQGSLRLRLLLLSHPPADTTYPSASADPTTTMTPTQDHSRASDILSSISQSSATGSAHSLPSSPPTSLGPSKSTKDSNRGNNGLSTGALAGIDIGVALTVCLATFCIRFSGAPSQSPS